MATPKAKYVYYFCDESSYVSDEFMAVGGLAVPDYYLPELISDLRAIKEAKRGPTETKWSTVKSRRDSAHRAFVDYFVDAIAAKRLHFHIRFAPFEKYDHKASGPKHRIDTTSKMHFQLLLHRAVRYYGKHYKLRIRPDNGDCTAALEGKIENLHKWGGDTYGCQADCIADIQPRDSKLELPLQLLDVPLGAMTALRNKRELIGAKRDLADYVSGKYPSLDLAKSTTGKGDMIFSVWNVTPSGAPKKRGPWG